MSKNTNAVNESPKFTKADILTAKKYREQRDLIEALLDGDGVYTLAQVDAIVNDFLTKEVK